MENKEELNSSKTVMNWKEDFYCSKMLPGALNIDEEFLMEIGTRSFDSCSFQESTESILLESC